MSIFSKEKNLFFFSKCLHIHCHVYDYYIMFKLNLQWILKYFSPHTVAQILFFFTFILIYATTLRNKCPNCTIFIICAIWRHQIQTIIFYTIIKKNYHTQFGWHSLIVHMNQRNIWSLGLKKEKCFKTKCHQDSNSNSFLMATGKLQKQFMLRFNFRVFRNRQRNDTWTHLNASNF